LMTGRKHHSPFGKRISYRHGPVAGLRCGWVLVLSQARTAVFQRGADIPGRPLGGGQAADDRNDRAVLADRLTCFYEVPGIFGGRRTGRVVAGLISHLHGLPWGAAANPSRWPAVSAAGIVLAGLAFLPRSVRSCPPGSNHCLHGIPFGWSHVAPFAVRRPTHRPRHALVSKRSRGRCLFCYRDCMACHDRPGNRPGKGTPCDT
jgi:hypothetical protein